MSDYQSSYARDRVLAIRAAQDSGTFVVSTSPGQPVPNLNELPGKRLAQSWTGDTFEVANGSRYRYESRVSAYVLSHGQIPEEFEGWPKAQPVEAIVRPGQVEIVGTEIVLDMDTSENRYGDLAEKVNMHLSLARTGMFVWAITREADNQNPISTIANESASVHASSLVWCHQDQALVAAVMVDTSTQTLQAIRATLASSRSRSLVTVKSPGGTAYASSIKRGYAAISASLAKANAVGMVQAIMHPLCGNPQEETGDHFYVVATPGENLAQKAGERLALAIPWPTNPEWTDYLLSEGKTASLVEDLPVIGPDFASALRIEKSQEGWQIIIAEGLRSGKIKI